MEQRGAEIEVRAKGRKLEGHAALFGVETRISDASRGVFREIIIPGAFAGSLAGDILALRDHNPSRVLGRTRSGTVKLAEDTKGLSFEIDVPDTTEGRDVLAMAERGDLGGMSFGFDVRSGGDVWSGDRRELRAVNLHEISVVSAWPAYPGTIVNARSGGVVHVSLARLYLETL